MLRMFGYKNDQVPNHHTITGLRLKVITLNINGINDQIKQMKLVSFLQSNYVDIALIQEHNVKDIKKIEYLNHSYHVIVNKSILFKGGTLIIIDKKLPSTFSSTYMHPTSHLSTKILNF